MRALSRKYANRKSTLRNLATSLILYERIKTTTAKAKEVKPVVERLIKIAQNNDLTARRRLMAYLFDENAAKKMLEIFVPRYKNIQSGFIKTYKLGSRLGDGADMMMMELARPVRSPEKESNNDNGSIDQDINISKKNKSIQTSNGVKVKDGKNRKATIKKPSLR